MTPDCIESMTGLKKGKHAVMMLVFTCVEVTMMAFVDEKVGSMGDSATKKTRRRTTSGTVLQNSVNDTSTSSKIGNRTEDILLEHTHMSRTANAAIAGIFLLRLICRSWRRYIGRTTMARSMSMSIAPKKSQKAI